MERQLLERDLYKHMLISRMIEENLNTPGEVTLDHVMIFGIRYGAGSLKIRVHEPVMCDSCGDFHYKYAFEDEGKLILVEHNEENILYMSDGDVEIGRWNRDPVHESDLSELYDCTDTVSEVELPYTMALDEMAKYFNMTWPRCCRVTERMSARDHVEALGAPDAIYGNGADVAGVMGHRRRNHVFLLHGRTLGGQKLFTVWNRVGRRCFLVDDQSDEHHLGIKQISEVHRAGMAVDVAVDDLFE